MILPAHRPDHPGHSRRRASGFTLIELVVTLAVFGVLLALAMPALRDLVINTRLSTASSEMQTALGLARNEAITRHQSVSVCPSANGTTCSGDWNNEQGVIVLTDSDSQVLKYIQINTASIKIITGGNNFGGSNSISFGAAGRLASTTSDGTLKFCDTSTSNYGRQLQVFWIGRVESSKNAICP